jgi:predicted nicotinamide N-methyase
MGNFSSVKSRSEPSTRELELALRGRFDVIEHGITVQGRIFDLRHPRSADDLISDEEFNRDERLPYWAEVWPSAYVLAQRIADEAASRRPKRRLLELGCGCGLAAVTAQAFGFDATAIDYYPEALEFVRLNAHLNDVSVPATRVVDWRRYPVDLVGFDFVVAADVLYERDYCRLVAAAFRQSLRPGGLGLLTDPQRSKAESFPDECRRVGLQVSAPHVFGLLSVPGGDAAVRQTVNMFEVRHTADRR